MAHREAGQPDPTTHEGVRRTLAGLRRSGPRRVQGLGGEDLERAIAAIPPRMRWGERDRAIVLLMRRGLLRRAKAAALRWRDLDAMHDGFGRLTIARSKTTRRARGRSST